jgi:hypothetical protein
MKIGDLVYLPELEASGLIVGPPKRSRISWGRSGQRDDTVWEVMYDDGEVGIELESDMVVINAGR